MAYPSAVQEAYQTELQAIRVRSTNYVSMLEYGQAQWAAAPGFAAR